MDVLFLDYLVEGEYLLSTDVIAGGNNLLTSGTASTVGTRDNAHQKEPLRTLSMTVAWLLLLLGPIWRPSICYACRKTTLRWELPPNMLGFLRVAGEYRWEQGSRGVSNLRLGPLSL